MLEQDEDASSWLISVGNRNLKNLFPVMRRKPPQPPPQQQTSTLKQLSKRYEFCPPLSSNEASALLIFMQSKLALVSKNQAFS
jgi:hypothetical protein